MAWPLGILWAASHCISHYQGLRENLPSPNLFLLASRIFNQFNPGGSQFQFPTDRLNPTGLWGSFKNQFDRKTEKQVC